MTANNFEYIFDFGSVDFWQQTFLIVTLPKT